MGGGVNHYKSISYNIENLERLAQWTLYEAIFYAEEWRFSHLNISVQNFSHSFLKTGRLDAEYYQPKYEKLLQIIQEKPCKTLGELVKIKKSVEPGSQAYLQTGVPFIRISNLSKMGISSTDIFLNEKDFSKNLYPKKDDILFSKDGTVGIAYKAEQDLKAITSGAILHLTIENKTQILPDYLTLLLNSVVVKYQAERDAGGSIIAHWKPSEISQVLIPIVSMEIQQQISALVQESFTLKNESEQLLQKAKELVEREIEKMG